VVARKVCVTVDAVIWDTLWHGLSLGVGWMGSAGECSGIIRCSVLGR
jgi:hypothetical protein